MKDLKDLPPPEKKDDTVVQLDAIGQETLVALLSSKTKTEAAEKLSLSRDALYNRIDKYKLDKLLAEIPKRALQQLQLGSVMAAEALTKLTDSKSEFMSFEASKEVLDRVGLGVGSAPSSLTQINIGKEMSIEFE